jgi:BirA family biotin operon repressor/biotin-[acetyl-CoA-carboxylase] ligase
MMELPLSETVAARLTVLDEIGSTNDELVSRATTGTEPHFSVLVTDSQTAGRGRLGRVWVAPRGKTLAISVLLRPVGTSGDPLGFAALGWLPLIAGVAMAEAVASVVPRESVGLKWPNDVQVGGLKISGLLAELLLGQNAVVLGAGINLSMSRNDLPTPTSTSLVLAGATLAGDALADAVLSAYIGQLRELSDALAAADGDAEASGIRRRVIDWCTTIGHDVRVELPGGDNLFARATGIDGDGRLEVTREADGSVTAVAAGDVTHLRYE